MSRLPGGDFTRCECPCEILGRSISAASRHVRGKENSPVVAHRGRT
jgi:hypothetical protein